MTPEAFEFMKKFYNGITDGVVVPYTLDRWTLPYGVMKQAHRNIQMMTSQMHQKS